MMSLCLLLAFCNHYQVNTSTSVEINREVTIDAANPAIKLAGTLSLPQGPGPFPVALLLTGDGGHLRDQIISGSPMFGMLSNFLTQQGIAVLRMDDRGVGKSTGPSAEKSTLAELAEDGHACLAWLRKQPEIDSKRIGLIGHSRGSLTGPLIALKEPDLAFLVLLAPPGVNGGEVWKQQKLLGLQSHKVKPEILSAVEVQLGRLVDYVRNGTDDDKTFYQLGHDFVAAHGMERSKITNELIDKLLSDLRSASARYFFKHDPATVLSQLHVPILAVYGSADSQVLAKQNLPPLAAALANGKNTCITMTMLHDQDHFFFTFEGKRMEKHVKGKMELSSNLLACLKGWLWQHVSKATK